jgi:hypothetical protein
MQRTMPGSSQHLLKDEKGGWLPERLANSHCLVALTSRIACEGALDPGAETENLLDESISRKEKRVRKLDIGLPKRVLPSVEVPQA